MMHPEILLPSLVVFAIGWICLMIGYAIGRRDGYSIAWQKYHGEPLATALRVDEEENDDKADHFVIEMPPTPESRIVAGLKDLAARLERGEAINATKITRESTPDGPMHTFEEVKLRRRGKGRA